MASDIKKRETKRPKTPSNDSRQLKRRKISEVSLLIRLSLFRVLEVTVFMGDFFDHSSAVTNYSKCMGHAVRFQITVTG